MNITHHTYDWMRVAMAVVGGLSIYLGYRLFCDVSHAKTQWREASARGVLMTNLVSGALLAVFGLGILIADVHGMRGGAANAHSNVRKKKATAEGSFEAPKVQEREHFTDRLV